MAALIRVTLRWVVILAVCQVGSSLAEAGSWIIGESGEPSLVGPSGLSTLGAPPCCGEYGRYAPADCPCPEWSAWSHVPIAPVPQIWTVDYRARQMFDSSTSYEFGVPPWDPAPFAPLSKLDFELDSPWHGTQIAVELPGWRVHFEWLMPMQQSIDGQMADFDWNMYAPFDPNRVDSLTLSSERWNEGHMLELGTEFKLTNSFLGWPLELWPTAGFRFQRFDITAFNISQIVPPNGPLPAYDGVDVITFNQQYYVGYFGAQLRGTVLAGRIPIDVSFQVDGGPSAGYNVDHHLLRLGDRYTMEETHGGAWHVGFMAEAHLTGQFSVGFQADHIGIRTTGTHRWRNEPFGIDERWSNGVIVKSDQSTLTAFVRYQF
jgi:hypothetical protein